MTTITINKLEKVFDTIYQWEGKDIMSPSYRKIKKYCQEMYEEIDGQSLDSTLKRMYPWMPDDLFDQWKKAI